MKKCESVKFRVPFFVFGCLSEEWLRHGPLIQNAAYFTVSRTAICLTLHVRKIFWVGKYIGIAHFNVTYILFWYTLLFFQNLHSPFYYILCYMILQFLLWEDAFFLSHWWWIWVYDLFLANEIIVDVPFRVELLHSCLWRTMRRTCFMYLLVR